MGTRMVKLYVIVALYGISVAREKVFVGLDFYSEKLRSIHYKYIQRSAPNCTTDADCDDKSQCFSDIQKCLCKEDEYIVNSDGTDCIKLPKVLGKDPCIEDLQCRAAFKEAQCLGSVCQCRENSRFAGKFCHKVVGLGEKCNTMNNCPIYEVSGHNHSYCFQGFCECPWGLQRSPDKKSCIIKAKLNSDCSIDAECITNYTECHTKCVCKNEYIVSRNNSTCLKVASTLGDNCIEDSQCEKNLQNSTCSNDTCTCAPNFHRHGTFCVKDVALNHSCESHFECITPSNKNSTTDTVTNVGCYNGTCQCSPGYKFVEDICDCIGYTELNGSVIGNKINYLLLTALFVVNICIIF